ncbi:hypothetical protein Tco_0216867 [Tanacetum coccineum]
MEAIEKRYGGNKESKKVQRTLLKQQYENYAGLSSETMDSNFCVAELISLVEDSSRKVNMYKSKSTKCGLLCPHNSITAIWQHKLKADKLLMEFCAALTQSNPAAWR